MVRAASSFHAAVLCPTVDHTCAPTPLLRPPSLRPPHARPHAKIDMRDVGSERGESHRARAASVRLDSIAFAPRTPSHLLPAVPRFSSSFVLGFYVLGLRARKEKGKGPGVC